MSEKYPNNRNVKIHKHCAKCYKTIEGIQFEEVSVLSPAGANTLYFHDGDNDSCYDSYVDGTYTICHPRRVNSLTFRQQNFQDRRYPEDQKWGDYGTGKK